MNADWKRDPDTYAIIGAAMEVHRELGHGFLESVYQDALEIEFKWRGISFTREEQVPVFYKGSTLGTPYRADFICYGSIIVELKAVKSLTEVELAQVLHYLKATGFHRALLIKFGTRKLKGMAGWKTRPPLRMIIPIVAVSHFFCLPVICPPWPNQQNVFHRLLANIGRLFGDFIPLKRAKYPRFREVFRKKGLRIFPAYVHLKAKNHYYRINYLSLFLPPKGTKPPWKP